jgi:hypothetical protein
VTAALDGFVGVDCGAYLVDVGAVAADEFVELVAGDAELVGPVSDVGGHFGVDFFGVVRTLGGVFLVQGMCFVAFGLAVVFGHEMLPLLFVLLV